MNTGTKTLINTIVESIQDVKGKHIVIANLEKIDDTEYNYLIICDGSSNSQIGSIVERVKDGVKSLTNEHPISIAGQQNAEWVAMDYGDIAVHTFLPDKREYYSLESLWADAKIITVPDLD